MAIAYLGSRISANQMQNAQGYRVCLGTPICRTGYQEYLGSELKRHPDYDAAWGLEDGEIYKVFRPVEEVTSPSTIASFEGADVVLLHPSEEIAPGSLISVETFDELSMGHGQNVRVGSELVDGETVLCSDLWLKHPEILDSIDAPAHERTRDISCGYTYKLVRRADGTLVQTKIRGNHIAVVPKGRAGPLIAIKDSAPPEKEKEKHRMTIKNRLTILGLGLQAAAKDQSPEEFTETLKGLGIGVDEAPKDKDDDKKDKEEKGAAKDHHRAAAHDALDRVLDARATATRMGKDAHGMDAAMPELKKELSKYIGDEEPEEKKDKDDKKDESAKDDKEELESMDDADETEEEKKEREKKEKESAKDAEVLEDTVDVDETGKSVLKALDSAAAFAKAMKPTVARILQTPKSKRLATDQAIVDSYNDAVRNVKAIRSGRASLPNPYTNLVDVKLPEGAAADAAHPAGLKSPTEFFAGKTFKQGQADWDAYLASTRKDGK